jgi:protoporphyrinogen oxidase
MKIVIIGGGLTGLAAAYNLLPGNDVVVLEKDNFLGGMASSYSVDWDGSTYKISKTYHHILDGDNTTIEYIKKFGLENKFHLKKVKQGFIYQNKILGFSTPIEILRFPMSLVNKIKLAKFMLFDLKHTNFDKLEGVNAKQWIIKKAGETNFNVFFDRLLRNKFHDSPENITASWFGTRMVKESSSFLKKFGWIEGGIGQIVDGFKSGIEKGNGKIMMNSEVISIDQKEKKIVYNENGTRGEMNFDILISTTSPEEFLNSVDSIPPEIKEQMEKIKYLSSVCFTFGLKKKVSDYYWINVLDNGLPFSVVFNDTALYDDVSPKGKSVIFVNTYLMRDEKLWAMTDDEIRKEFIESVKKILPEFEEQIEWSKLFKVKNAEAIYNVGFKNPAVNYNDIYFAGIYRIYPKIRNMASAMEEGINVANEIKKRYPNV